jgi:hypothetical protein
MSPTWVKSAVIVRAIPDGMSASEIEADPRVLEAAQAVSSSLEGIGYAVFARVVPLKVVDDLVGGTARVAWRKLQKYIESERQRAGSQKSWEWFQWLVEQVDRHRPSDTTLTAGAQQVYRDWKP